MGRTFVALMVLTFLCTAQAQGNPTYILVNLGTLRGGTTFAAAITPSGTVVGTEFSQDSNTSRAVLWKSGTARDLGAPGATILTLGVNAREQVVGIYTAANGLNRSFIWDSRGVRDIGVLSGSRLTVTSINDRGQIAGGVTVENTNLFKAFIWDGTALNILYANIFYSSRAVDVNNSGLALIEAQSSEGGPTQVFTWKGNQIRGLGSLGGSVTFGSRLSRSGMATGASSLPNSDDLHAFLWDGSKMLDLGTLGGAVSYGRGINPSGTVVVGTSTTADGKTSAFIWNGSAMVNLNTLIDSASDWDLQDAIAVNDAGWIVGSGFHNGVARAYLLMPASAGYPAASRRQSPQH